MVGHNTAINRIKHAARQGRLAHAYLITGPPHVGKMTIATHLAQVVNCISEFDPPCEQCAQCRRIFLGHHSDIMIISLETNGAGRTKKEISIDSVRIMQHASALQPYEGDCRVFIVNGAEQLSEEASNALLKLLEEPPPQSMFVLLASHAQHLLPTIQSRCRLVELLPLPLEIIARALTERHSISYEEALRLSRLSRGCPGWALSATQDASVLESRSKGMDQVARLTTCSIEERFGYAASLASTFAKDRGEVMGHLFTWLSWWREALLFNEGAGDFALEPNLLAERFHYINAITTRHIIDFIKVIHNTITALESNVNPRLALELLMSRIPGSSH